MDRQLDHPRRHLSESILSRPSFASGVVRKFRPRISESDRVMIVGKTGCGKTVWASFMLGNRDDIVVLDTLWRIDPRRTKTFEKARIIRTIKDFETFCEHHFYKGNFIVYIDELLELTEVNKDLFVKLVTRGRAHNISVWYSTQRPRGIPRVAISECEHYVIFTLNLVDDRKFMYEQVGREEVLSKPVDKHGFWYYDIRRDILVYSPGIDIKTHD